MNVDSSSEYLLEARNIVKVFGELRANDDVTLSLKPGEIHALLGENGAGKSTLVKIIYGSLQATSGQLFWKGQPVTVANPAAARELGIGMVFQHFSLFDALTVTENIALALPADVDIGALAGRIEKVSNDYGLPLRPDALVADLSVGERQRIEIVRCLLQEPRLLIMDEPTAVLTPQEADQLFVTLERLASEGCGVLYISHRLEEVKRICHDATILRHGKLVARVDPQQETAASLANLMVGAEVAAVKADRGGVPGSSARSRQRREAFVLRADIPRRRFGRRGQGGSQPRAGGVDAVRGARRSSCRAGAVLPVHLPQRNDGDAARRRGGEIIGPRHAVRRIHRRRTRRRTANAGAGPHTLQESVAARPLSPEGVRGHGRGGIDPVDDPGFGRGGHTIQLLRHGGRVRLSRQDD